MGVPHFTLNSAHHGLASVLKLCDPYPIYAGVRVRVKKLSWPGMSSVSSVLESAKFIASHAQHVQINKAAVIKAAHNVCAVHLEI